jgi:hypothetical protein
MLEIAKGIPGSRAILAADNKGWHIYTQDGYWDYADAKLSEIRQSFPRKGTITSFTASSVVFITTEVNR